MKEEHSLVLTKPDGVELSLTGEVIAHMERDDMHLVGMKAVEVTEKLAAGHYHEHRNKMFFKDIIKYLTGGYHSFSWVYAFVYCGTGACNTIRKIVGRTNPLDTDDGKKIVSLRQKYGRNVIVKGEDGKAQIDDDGHVLVRFENVIHASWSKMSEYEVKLWFKPSEILTHYRLYPVIENQFGELEWEESAQEIIKRMKPV